MTTATRLLRAGTRSSNLARRQTQTAMRAISARTGAACGEVLIATAGDRAPDVPLPEIGETGIFTAALEAALRDGSIDFAVHSLKDLPVAQPDDLVLAAICERADPRDVVITRDRRMLEQLPHGAAVGTSSVRRMAQLRAARPGLRVVPLRGNVDTRVRKALAGEYDAIVIAAAGVLRLGLEDAVSQYLPYETMIPAPGQGALAIQCRANDQATRALCRTLDDPLARCETEAERAFLEALGGGCAAPMAAVGRAGPEQLRLLGLVAAPDGATVVRVSGSASPGEATALARRLAADAIARGARAVLG